MEQDNKERQHKDLEFWKLIYKENGMAMCGRKKILHSGNHSFCVGVLIKALRSRRKTRARRMKSRRRKKRRRKRRVKRRWTPQWTSIVPILLGDPSDARGALQTVS